MLNYNIKGTGMDVSDELRSYVERQLAHAEKFLQGDTTAHVDVELEHRSHGEGERNRAEFTVSASGTVYRAESTGESAHAAIDLAIAELQKELRRNKSRRMHLVRRGAQKLKDYLRGFGASE